MINDLRMRKRWNTRVRVAISELLLFTISVLLSQYIMYMSTTCVGLLASIWLVKYLHLMDSGHGGL